jgi:hypothetical protein
LLVHVQIFLFLFSFSCSSVSWAVCEIPSSHHTLCHHGTHHMAPTGAIICPPCHHSRSTWVVATS